MWCCFRSFQKISPVFLLKVAAFVYNDRTSLRYGGHFTAKKTYKEHLSRRHCRSIRPSRCTSNLSPLRQHHRYSLLTLRAKELKTHALGNQNCRFLLLMWCMEELPKPYLAFRIHSTVKKFCSFEFLRVLIIGIFLEIFEPPQAHQI